MISIVPHDLKRDMYAFLKPNSFSFYQNLRTSDRPSHTLKPFDKTKSIFVHIPKAAGISLSTSLYGKVTGSHLPISKYQLIYSKAEFESYFKFTLTRNPWDRVFSAFNFLKKGGRNAEDADWAQKYLSEFTLFEDFLDSWVNEKTIWSYIHFYPQHYFILVPGKSKSPLDFIGKVETIEQDYSFIASKIEGAGSLEHLNASVEGKSKDYRNIYLPRHIDLISKIYKRDIDLFSYTFEGIKK
ncbi:MAG: sulfotransferase family 2 domain-containing protein [Saprospiraceae bacterium]|nr:sulfotransferase family 2 domain-containing protein [Saprospiraceae bacterium]